MTARPEEDWARWIGHTGEVVYGRYPVSVAAIGYLAEALEDNRLADSLVAGNGVAPRSFVTIASRVPNWLPTSATGPRTFMQGVTLPLPTDAAVNMAVDQHYLAPLRVGDRISSQSTIMSIVPKRTRLGDGFVVSEEIVHRNQDGVTVARTINQLLRYKKAPPAEPTTKHASSSATQGAPANEDHVGLLPITMPITMTRLVTAAAAVRDFSPLHHDVEFARSAGHATVFVSFSHQLAILCRALGEWYGGDERLRRLTVAMKASIYLGKTATCRGKRNAGNTEPGVEIIDLTLATEDGTCTMAVAEVVARA